MAQLQSISSQERIGLHPDEAIDTLETGDIEKPTKELHY